MSGLSADSEPYVNRMRLMFVVCPAHPPLRTDIEKKGSSTQEVQYGVMSGVGIMSHEIEQVAHRHTQFFEPVLVEHWI